MDSPRKDRLYGPDRLAIELAKKMKRENPQWDVNILALSNSSGQNCIEGVRINRIYYKKPLVHKILWAIKNLVQIKPEIIHSHGSYLMGFVTLIVGTTFRTRKMLTIDEFQENAYSNLLPSLSRLDRIIVQTGYARDRLIQRGIPLEKIKTVRYGVEDLFLNPKECPEVRDLGEKVILFYGDAREE